MGLETNPEILYIGMADYTGILGNRYQDDDGDMDPILLSRYQYPFALISAETSYPSGPFFTSAMNFNMAWNPWPTGQDVAAVACDADDDGDTDVRPAGEQSDPYKMLFFRNGLVNHTQYLLEFDNAVELEEHLFWDLTDNLETMTFRLACPGGVPAEATDIEMGILVQAAWGEELEEDCFRCFYLAGDEYTTGFSIDLPAFTKAEFNPWFTIYNVLFRFVTRDQSGKITKVWPRNIVLLCPDAQHFVDCRNLEPTKFSTGLTQFEIEASGSFMNSIPHPSNDPGDTGSTGGGTAVGGGGFPGGTGSSTSP